MKTGISKKFIKIALLLSLAISFTIHFSLIANFFFEDQIGGHNFSFGFIIFELFSTFFIGMVLFILNYSLYKPFKVPSKLAYKNIVSSLILTVVITVVIILIFLIIENPFIDAGHSRRHTEIFFSRNLFAAAVVLISIFIMRLVFQKQAIELENEKLKSESLQSQFESLKNQVSPHFLFNSLTALKTLIKESPKLADQYITHLAQVLRYTLQSNKRQTVTLDEELEFTGSYIFLLKMRYETNLSVKIEIDENKLNYRLPPLTIQTLVENAVKHNEISKDFPLLITIKTFGGNNLLVKNRIQEKLTPEEGTGIGLTNLTKLFHLLGEDDIQIIKDESEFRVEVPLLKP